MKKSLKPPSKTRHHPKLKNKTIVFGLSGSIACYKVCDPISQLSTLGVNVQCVLTDSAKQFITPLTLSSLSGRAVYDNQFMAPPFSEPLHTYLARRADLIVIAPATANIMAKMARGQADDLLTSVVLATEAQVLMVPAMNEQMWKNSFTQENVSRLRKAGFEFIEPVRGHLVCQVEGLGHIADPNHITDRIIQLLS